MTTAVLYVIASSVAGFDVAGGFASNGYGAHSPGGYSMTAALIAEIVLTFIFLIIILGATDERVPAGFAPLAIGIGLQNFPEGAAVSLPLRREGMAPSRSFLMGQASGMVEPIAGVIGALFVLVMQPILPYALCFAAGAMIFVVVEELIPESQRNYANIDLVTMATMVGFSVMMILDVSLG